MTSPGRAEAAGAAGRQRGIAVDLLLRAGRRLPVLRTPSRYAHSVPATATGDQSEPPQTRPGLLASLLDRFGHLVRELSKFATVGGVAFLVDLVLFNYATTVRDVEPLLAKTISTIIAATVAFVGNRFWTWRHRARSNPAREYALFFFFNAVGLGIAVACLAISRYGLGSIWPDVFRTVLADNIASFVVGTGLGTLFRFWSYRRFVFVEAGNRETAAEVTTSPVAPVPPRASEVPETAHDDAVHDRDIRA